MKTIKFIPIVFLFLLASCEAVRVNADYDKNVDFSKFKTFAYYKAGIDKVEISDLDKKRILRSIDEIMIAKGFTKNENPDLLINIFTKSREQINVNQFNSSWGYGWRFGWNPYGYGGQTTVSSSTEGTLYIDLIDAKKKEMIWQGEGQGDLTKNHENKDENIKEFVRKILEQYPPRVNK